MLFKEKSNVINISNHITKSILSSSYSKLSAIKDVTLFDHNLYLVTLFDHNLYLLYYPMDESTLDTIHSASIGRPKVYESAVL